MSTSYSESVPCDELANRCKNGDESAYTELVNRHSEALRIYLSSRCGHKVAPEDVTQEVWINVLNKIDTFQGTQFRRWLFRIGKNKLTDIYRKKTPGLQTTDTSLGEVDPAEDIEIEHSDPERLEALRICLKTLGSDFIDLIRRHLSGESWSEIAEKLGLPMGSVYSGAHRGRAQLRDCIESRLAI